MPVRSLLAEPVYDDRIGDHGWDGQIVGFRLPEQITDDQREAARQALGWYTASCGPLDPVSLAHELAVLRERMAHRKSDPQGWSLELDSLIDDLADYPADIVVRVIRDHRKRGVWWPRSGELVPEIERQCAVRGRIIDALQAAVRQPPPAITKKSLDVAAGTNQSS